MGLCTFAIFQTFGYSIAVEELISDTCMQDASTLTLVYYYFIFVFQCTCSIDPHIYIYVHVQNHEKWKSRNSKISPVCEGKKVYFDKLSRVWNGGRTLHQVRSEFYIFKFIIEIIAIFKQSLPIR